MFRNYKFRYINIRLIIYCVLITVIGVLVIGSAGGEDYKNKQIIGMIVGVIIMTVVALIDYSLVIRFSWVYYIIAGILLLAVFTPYGYNAGTGATRWLRISGFTFQPSEFAKLLLILFFAAFFMKHEEDINKPKTLLKTAILAAIPLVLIIREPDLSTTIVTFLTIAMMLFAAGLTYKIVVAVLGVTIPTIIIFLILEVQGKSLLKGYQDRRILAWLHPEEHPGDAYQQQNSIMAIGSGQMLGKGLYNTSAYSVKNGNFIPEPHTDFIFAVAGEELGFIGAVAIIVLLFLIAFEILRMTRKAKDMAGKIICVGVASLIAIQSFVNISVVTGLLPNTGLPLPFVSYGLTSLITLYIGIGLVLNVGIQPKKTYIDEMKPLKF